MPFHLTYSVLTSWGFKFNEAEINLMSLNIGSIEANLFSRFACLKRITLKNNKILRLHQDTFKNCNCLIYLDMSFIQALSVKLELCNPSDRVLSDLVKPHGPYPIWQLPITLCIKILL